MRPHRRSAPRIQHLSSNPSIHRPLRPRGHRPQPKHPNPRHCPPPASPDAFPRQRSSPNCRNPANPLRQIQQPAPPRETARAPQTQIGDSANTRTRPATPHPSSQANKNQACSQPSASALLCKVPTATTPHNPVQKKKAAAEATALCPLSKTRTATAARAESDAGYRHSSSSPSAPSGNPTGTSACLCSFPSPSSTRSRSCSRPSRSGGSPG